MSIREGLREKTEPILTIGALECVSNGDADDGPLPSVKDIIIID